MENVFGGLPPEIYAALQAQQRKQKLTELLMQQSMQPLEPPVVKGRFQGAIHPLQGLAQIAQSYVAGKEMDEQAKGMADIGKKYREGEAADMAKYIAMRQGTPAQPEEVMPADIAGPPQPAQEAIAGDPRKAIEFAQMSQYLRKNPLVAQDYAQLSRPPVRTDLGDRFKVEYADGRVLYEPKGVTPDTTLREAGADRRHTTPSGSATLGATTTTNTSLLNPAVVQARKDIAAAGKTNVNVNQSVASGDKKYAEERGRSRAEQMAQLEKSGESAARTIDAMDRFIASSATGTGGGAQPVITGVKNLLSSFGYADKDLTSVRVMEQALGDVLQNKMAELGARGLTDRDMDILRRALPRVEIDPASRVEVAEIVKKSALGTINEYKLQRAEEERVYPELASKVPEPNWFRKYKNVVGGGGQGDEKVRSYNFATGKLE